MRSRRLINLIAGMFFVMNGMCGSACATAERTGIIVAPSSTDEREMRTSDQYVQIKRTGSLPADARMSTDATPRSRMHERELERLKEIMVQKNQYIKSLEERLARAEKNVREMEAQVQYESLQRGRVYEVKKGESLWRIARRADVYGDGKLWIKLFNANMDRISDPHRIFPGQLIRVPA